MSKFIAAARAQKCLSGAGQAGLMNWFTSDPASSFARNRFARLGKFMSVLKVHVREPGSCLSERVHVCIELVHAGPASSRPAGLRLS